MGSKGRGKVKKVLGATAEGLPDTPKKMSNVKLSRLVHGEDRGCSRCFPHGPETSNSTRNQNRRSWKNNRKTKYRPKKAGRDAEPRAARAKINPKPWEWEQSHEIGCCYPVGAHRKGQIPPDQRPASRSGVNSTCTPSHGRTQREGTRKQAA